MNDSKAKVEVQAQAQKPKHLYLLDRIHNMDDAINELKYLIQEINPSDAKEEAKVDPPYREMPLFEFLTEGPAVMDGKQDKILNLIGQVRDLVL